MPKKKATKEQLSLGFEKGMEIKSTSNSNIDSNKEAQEVSHTKVIYFDARKDIYMKILNRQMK